VHSHFTVTLFCGVQEKQRCRTKRYANDPKVLAPESFGARGDPRRGQPSMCPTERSRPSSSMYAPSAAQRHGVDRLRLSFSIVDLLLRCLSRCRLPFRRIMYHCRPHLLVPPLHHLRFKDQTRGTCSWSATICFSFGDLGVCFDTATAVVDRWHLPPLSALSEDVITLSHLSLAQCTWTCFGSVKSREHEVRI
jgi:hypothetical protein